MDSNTLTLSEQVNDLLSELQSLRIKSENDDKMIHILKVQYESLSSQMRGIRQDAIREVETARQQRDADVHEAEIERDKAITAYKTIETLLLRSADLIMQAARARVGDATPAQMPHARLPQIEDERLPRIGLAT